MNGSIRPATEGDAPRILELEQVFPNSLTEPMIIRELKVGRGFVFIDPHQRVWGYALLRHEGDLLDLTRLAVDPSAEKQGVGGRLLDYVCTVATLEGLACVLTVKKDNRRALRLYQRAGFRIVGHYEEERAWAMRRDAPASARPSDC